MIKIKLMVTKQEFADIIRRCDLISCTSCVLLNFCNPNKESLHCIENICELQLKPKESNFLYRDDVNEGIRCSMGIPKLCKTKGETDET